MDGSSVNDASRIARALDALRERWESLDILNGHGASDEEIAAFELHYDVVLPDDLRTYFARVNGTTQGKFGMEDESFTGFWHLDQVRTLAEEGSYEDPEAAHSFVIADHSIWCHAFAVRLSADRAAPTPVVVDLNSPLNQVAGSFIEFIERYLDDPVVL